MWRKIFFSIVLVGIAYIPVFADMKIAVMDFEVLSNVTRQEGAIISDLIRSEMVNINLFTVVERSQINQVLREQGFQMTGCTDVTCAVKIGKLLSARKILVGTITKIGETYIINGRIVDIEKGVAEYSSKEKALNKESLDQACEQFVIKLADNIAMKANEPELADLWKEWKKKKKKEEKNKPAAQRVDVPTGTPSYVRSGATSIVFLLAGGGLAYGGYAFNVKYKQVNSDYNRRRRLGLYLIWPTLMSASTVSEAQAYYNRFNSAMSSVRKNVDSQKAARNVFISFSVITGTIGIVTGIISIFQYVDAQQAYPSSSNFRLFNDKNISLIAPCSIGGDGFMSNNMYDSYKDIPLNLNLGVRMSF
jgi:TolB-like protein